MVAAIIEAILTFFGAIIEAIVGFFIAGAEVLTAGEILAIVLLLCVELVLWVLYCILELLRALVQRRKPRAVRKPVLWRPAKLEAARRSAQKANSAERAR